MAKETTTITTTEQVMSHPSVRAWASLGVGGNRPRAVEVLKESGGSMVYRLIGARAGGSAVVAKRRRLESDRSLVERTAYSEFFPRLPVPSLEYVGFAEDEDPRFGWLFLEDAGRNRLSPWNEEHRALAGQWLGYLHVYGPDADPEEHLPSRQIDYHLRCLRAAQNSIRDGMGNPTLTSDDAAVLTTIVSLLDRLASRWDGLEEATGLLPRTVVLGNFVRRNSFVRARKGITSLLIVDCESLAWGNPIADLAQSYLRSYGGGFSANPSLAAYFQVISERWPLDLPSLQRLAEYGTLLRCVATISWDAAFLGENWAAGPMDNLRWYQHILSHAMHTVGY
jgi:hypothetical protein